MPELNLCTPDACVVYTKLTGYIFFKFVVRRFFLMRVKLNLTAIGYMHLIGNFNCIYCVLSVQHEYQ